MATEDPPWTADGIPRLPTVTIGGLLIRARGCSPSLLGPGRMLCPKVSAFGQEHRRTEGRAGQPHTVRPNTADTVFFQQWENFSSSPGSPRLVLTRALGPVCIVVDQIPRLAPTHRQSTNVSPCFAAAGQAGRARVQDVCRPGVRELACCRTA